MVLYLPLFGISMGAELISLYSDFNGFVYAKRKCFDYNNDELFARFLSLTGGENRFLLRSLGLLLKYYLILVGLFAACYYLTESLKW